MADKFEPVDVQAQDCTESDLDAHIRAFVAGFVLKARRDRVVHIVLEAPQKARSELHHVRGWLDPKTARELVGSAAFPLPLARSLGSQRGVYFDDSGHYCLVTPAEAATLATLNTSDAILSLIPGKLALFFHHDEGLFLCKRT